MTRRAGPSSPAPAAAAPAGGEPSGVAPIRLVAIDLDGTLLNDSKQVTEQTAGALGCLPQRGVKVIIASARPPRSVRHVYMALGLDTWQINYNGALIWDEPSKRAIYHAPMACEIVWSVIERARGLYPECLISCEILDKWYTDREDNTYTTETGRLFKPHLVAPLEVYCSQPITKLMVLGPRDMIDALEPVLRAENPVVSVIRSDPELIQVMHHQASKAGALRKVARHYKVPMTQVMAIGDAMNDVPMLKAAAVAVAMDNAHPAVKEIATWVAPSNNDHGVHAALVRFGLCE